MHYQYVMWQRAESLRSSVWYFPGFIKILGSYDSECEAGCLLGCATLWSGRIAQTFRRINHHRGGGSGNSETFVVRRHIPVSFRFLRLESKPSPQYLFRNFLFL
jgi:hypothetical protein